MENSEVLEPDASDKVEYILVRQLVNFFSTNQVTARRRLHELLVRSPARAIDSVYRVLIENSAGAAEPFLLTLMAADETRLAPLVASDSIDFASAVRLAGALSRTDPGIEAMLLRVALREHQPETILRALSLIAEFSDCTRVAQQLQLLSRQPNELIRSKAARLILRVSRERDRLVQLLTDSDPRVRANAAEAFLSLEPKPAEIEELWRLAGDNHHRPATTALAALALNGDVQAIHRLIELVNAPNPPFQLAAAWAMGRTQNPVFLTVLQNVIREQSGSLKRMSMRSCALIRKGAATTPSGQHPAGIPLSADGSAPP